MAGSLFLRKNILLPSIALACQLVKQTRHYKTQLLYICASGEIKNICIVKESSWGGLLFAIIINV